MQTVTNVFSDEEAVAVAVNYNEDLNMVADYISDTGITVPVALDNAKESSETCWDLPGGEDSLTVHFQNLVGNPKEDPPFPIHVLIDQNGVIRYLKRTHQPKELIQAILSAVTTP